MRLKKPIFSILILSMYLLLCGFTYEDKSTNTYNIPENSGFKCFMSYKAITSHQSEQYELQTKCYTDENGIRKYDERYCVAVGTFCQAGIGQKIDIVLENGITIKCIVGDIKADKDTDSTNTFTQNGCCSEFIVDTKCLDKGVKYTGDISDLNNNWDSPVAYIFVHEKSPD